MKKLLLLGCMLMLVTACAPKRSATEQVQEVRAVTVPEYRPSIIEVRNAIFAGVHAAKWRAQDRAPGLIYATDRWRGSLVTLEIDYTATQYVIRYTTSTHDDYTTESGNIPKEFPRWESFIAKNIDEKIAVIGLEAQIQIEAFPRIAPSLPGEPITLEGKVKDKDDKALSGIKSPFDPKGASGVLVGKPEKEHKGDEALTALPAAPKASETIPTSDRGETEPLPVHATESQSTSVQEIQPIAPVMTQEENATVPNLTEDLLPKEEGFSDLEDKQEIKAEEKPKEKPEEKSVEIQEDNQIEKVEPNLMEKPERASAQPVVSNTSSPVQMSTTQLTPLPTAAPMSKDATEDALNEPQSEVQDQTLEQAPEYQVKVVHAIPVHLKVPPRKNSAPQNDAPLAPADEQTSGNEAQGKTE